MALRLTQRLKLLGQAGTSLHPPAGRSCISRLLGGKVLGDSACLWTSAGRCGYRKLQTDCGKMRLSIIARDLPPLAAGSVGLHKDSAPRFRLTQLHRPTDEEQAFAERLGGCSSSRQVLRLLRSVEMISDIMVAAVLHRLSDLEGDVNSLKDPTVLESDIIKALCFQLEQDSTRLTDEGLVSALLACTRLYLDPWSTLMVRLVSESQERLDRGRMSVGQLCVLGRAMLALEGPSCGLLVQVMEQVQNQEPDQWSPTELIAVYGLLQGGAAEGGRYQVLLNNMHVHAVTATYRMGPPAVSSLLSALVSLDQRHAMRLVAALCKQAVRHMGQFSDEEMTLVLGALMHFGHSDSYFVGAMERHVSGTAFTAHPETITKVMQYFGRRNILSLPVFDAVAESFVCRADDYSTSQVARQIMPFGKLGYLPPNAEDLFQKLETTLQRRFSQFQPRTLLNLLHSCILVERFPINFVSQVFSGFFLQQLQEQGTGINHIVLAQLTQLFLTVKLECPSYQGPNLLPKFRVKSFLSLGRSLETPVNGHFYNRVRAGLEDLLGARSYFASKVLTPYCYTLDVEIKLDEEGYVLPASHHNNVYGRIALCIDGQKRFTLNTRRLLGKEATKQRHLRILGYKVIQIPFDEFDKQQSRRDVVEYLHQKIFPHSYRHSW